MWLSLSNATLTPECKGCMESLLKQLQQEGWNLKEEVIGLVEASIAGFVVIAKVVVTGKATHICAGTSSNCRGCQ